jgi:hypothetical protein
MKKLIILLCLFIATAHAEEWFEMPNQAGGKMLLLTGKCTGKNGGSFVISTTSTGDTLNGCWYFFANMIHIIWEDGSRSSFNPSSFKYINLNERRQ